MKRLIYILPVILLVGLAGMALAGDFHVGTNLVCSDCHVMHGSQTHDYTVGNGTGTVFPPIGPAAPYHYLLRDDPVMVCLACHNGKAWAPDVFGASATNTRRLAGGLNVLNTNTHGLTNESGYDENYGHTLFSGAMPPGAGTTPEYTPSSEGLGCTDCHAQHGSTTQYRNLLNRGIFSGNNVTYNHLTPGTNDPTKDVFERSAAAYTEPDVDFNEPTTTASAYGAWCKNCHTDFHGSGGDPNMGSQSGGTGGSGGPGWVRHPAADVNIGTPSATFISSLTAYNAAVDADHRVKVLTPNADWRAATVAAGATPSCMSCHKAHGNKNPFGLIFMDNDSSAPVTENGNGGSYKDLCRNCHVQGA